MNLTFENVMNFQTFTKTMLVK